MENNIDGVVLGLGSDTKAQLDQHTQKIRELNDQFRRSLQGGRVVTTPGVIALGNLALMKIVTCVRVFDDFSEANDPYGEHDFGTFVFSIDGGNDGQKAVINWKIDYYDKQCEYGSEDPSKPSQTTRVLTIYLASEH